MGSLQNHKCRALQNLYLKGVSEVSGWSEWVSGDEQSQNFMLYKSIPYGNLMVMYITYVPYSILHKTLLS